MVQKSGVSPADMVKYTIIYKVFIHPSCRMLANNSMSSWNPAMSLGFSSFLKIQLPIKTRDQGSFGLQVVVVFLQTIKYSCFANNQILGLAYFFLGGRVVMASTCFVLRAWCCFLQLLYPFRSTQFHPDEGKPNVVGWGELVWFPMTHVQWQSSVRRYAELRAFER